MDLDNLDDFTRAYFECALWSSTCDDQSPMDDRYGIEDIEPDSVKDMIADCLDFRKQCAFLLSSQSDSQNGYDFWLTRNGHGAGFRDRGLGKRGELLTEVTKVCGPSTLYENDECYLTMLLEKGDYSTVEEPE